MIYRNVQHINCTVINVEKLELTFEVCADLWLIFLLNLRDGCNFAIPVVFSCVFYLHIIYTFFILYNNDSTHSIISIYSC